MDEKRQQKIEGVIFDIKKYAIHDGPGIRTTVFFKGCPLRCTWCHNPESWSLNPELMLRIRRCTKCGQCVELCPQHAVTMTDEAPTPITNPNQCSLCGHCIPYCPSQAREIAGRRVSVDDIMTEIVKDCVFYDESGGGATFSGGEPLMQPEFLAALLIQCRKQNIHTTVDTCCYASSQIVKKIAPLADLFLCDIKHLDPDKHKQFTGVDNTRILENITYLAESDCSVVIRIPIVPGFNDTTDQIAPIVDFVKSLKTIQQIDILPYNSGGVHKAERLGQGGHIMDQVPPDTSLMENLAAVIRRENFKVNIGG